MKILHWPVFKTPIGCSKHFKGNNCLIAIGDENFSLSSFMLNDSQLLNFININLVTHFLACVLPIT